jgi:hypothetical protein
MHNTTLTIVTGLCQKYDEDKDSVTFEKVKEGQLCAVILVCASQSNLYCVLYYL